ncbi:hypothetical protein SCE1572_41865 [Sorangium cellulosum So0157-2]|uniref:Uncharacterized protein n=1 Tax=Sorangium cellulosum So0157-2 TaxID=1254432 RepID=S4YCE8_SORCE|nr:hypothetical protein SCE1572_41865 [Sorangium cellulosum So0157-2]
MLGYPDGDGAVVDGPYSVSTLSRTLSSSVVFSGRRRS